MSKLGIIHAPVVSEKSFRLAAAGQYTFRVDPRATAPAIAAAIAELYAVNVVAIRTANQLGKVTRYKGRAGRRSDEKKAIVTLKTGQRIAGFEIEQPEVKDEKASSAPKASKKLQAAAETTESKKSGVTTTVRTGKKEAK